MKGDYARIIERGVIVRVTWSFVSYRTRWFFGRRNKTSLSMSVGGVIFDLGVSVCMKTALIALS
jgi:hypothetical protein